MPSLTAAALSALSLSVLSPEANAFVSIARYSANGQSASLSLKNMGSQKVSGLPLLMSSNKDTQFRNPEAEEKSVGAKLFFDERTGRFYEKKLDELCEDDEFCMIDEDTKQPILLTTEEKERIFLDSIQAYYYDGRQNLKDEDFDRLKADLAWEGSKVVTLSRQENLFLQAMKAYQSGSPTMEDSEFDKLKAELLEQGSQIAVSQEPTCYVDTGLCKATWEPDGVRRSILYFPFAAVATVIWLAISYELLSALGVPANPLVLLLVGSPLIVAITKVLGGEVAFKDPEIASGPCPSCRVENRVFFGDILGVEGPATSVKIKCSNCKSDLQITRANFRVSTIPEPNQTAASGGSAAKKPAPKAA